MSDLSTSPHKDLRVSLIQTDIAWGNPEHNRAMLAEKIEPLAGETNLIVLPEMFTSGFNPDGEPNTDDLHATSDWLLALAEKTRAAITGSVASYTENALPTNRLLFARPDGVMEHYDKRHLFRMAGEHKRYSQGNERKVIEWMGWHIMLTVCYDLRFPVFCRSTNDYDLMLCVANWPVERRGAWRKLLQARAIENLAYVVGVNRIGQDGRQLSYAGDSMAVGYDGNPIIDRAPNQPFVETVQLDAKTLGEYRTDFPCWRDADPFSLQLD